MNTRRSQAGFGIVEVMVALVVLAVGMLGIASLYVTTLRSTGSAISRMQAVNLVSDLADRIRANRFARTAYTEDGEDIGCSGVKNCDPTEMAHNDRYLWEQQIDALFKRNDPKVEFQLGAAKVPDTYTITLSWWEPNSDEPLTYALTMQVDP